LRVASEGFVVLVEMRISGAAQPIREVLYLQAPDSFKFWYEIFSRQHIQFKFRNCVVWYTCQAPTNTSIPKILRERHNTGKNVEPCAQAKCLHYSPSTSSISLCVELTIRANTRLETTTTSSAQSRCSQIPSTRHSLGWHFIHTLDHVSAVYVASHPRHY
jgi:hypothetical protein